MSLDDTYLVEKEKWNALAKKKEENLEKFRLKPGEDFYAFNRSSATHVGVNEFLGDLSDKHVLEYGCGLGQMSSLLAKNCAKVTSFDISINSVEVTRKRGKLNNVDEKIELIVSAGENLAFASESFDVIFGKAILHHLNVGLGWQDLYRMLKPGGKAVFIEPMGMNPILNFARDHLPYISKNPRGADSPLIYEEIHAWGKGFREFRYQEIQLFSMMERVLGRHFRLKALRKLDAFLLRHFPFLRKYCRYVVMYMVK
jgi:ubiquinone/menaquinone biosynthesis C-methylase UbiE